MRVRDILVQKFMPRNVVAIFIGIGILLSTAFPAFVEAGFTTLEAMVDTATLQVGPQPVVVGADFYSATSQWGNLFPRKGVTSKFEKTGSLLTLRLKDNLGNEATHRYLAQSNGARMELEAFFAPSENTSIAVWDIFLARYLFAGAIFKQAGASNKILQTNNWETVEVDDLVLQTEAGDWKMTLVGDHAVKWKLRSVCDRKWGDPEKQTFSLLYQYSGIPPTGLKLKLSVDLAFSPKPGYLAAVEKRVEERAMGYLKGLRRTYGEAAHPLEGKDLFAHSAEIAKMSSGLKEDRIPLGNPTIIPQPKQMSVGKGAFSFVAARSVYCTEEGAWQLLFDEISARGGKLDRVTSVGKAGLVMGLLSDTGVQPAASSAGILTKELVGRNEAYAISVKEGAVVIAANELAGLVHGVQAFCQVLRPTPNGVEAPVINVFDFPDLAFRGFYLEGAGSIMGTGDFRRLLRHTYSKFHGNAVMAELRWSQIKWKSHPEISGPNAKSLDDLRASAKEAESLGIEFIPALFSYGKVDDILKAHPNLAEDPAWKKKGAAWCPNRPETYTLFFDLLKEVVEATGCRRVHIGHDEIQGMALCPACKAIPPDDLFANDVNRIAGWLAERKVGTMIWGDFLLDHKYWSAQGATATHSGNPHFGNLAVHPAVGKISKTVVICDWHYEAGKSFPTLKYFSDAGYPVIACPWHLEENNTGITRAVAAIKQLGVLTTDWGFLVARAPGANSILGPVLGWNLAQPDGGARTWNADALLAASLLPLDRPSRYLGAQKIPFDISPAGTAPLSGDASAWFGQGPGRDLTLLPRGHQNLFGTPYHIGPKAVVVDEKRPNAPALMLGRKVKSLIFLQGLMVEDLSVGARAYATYRVTRGDGSVTNLVVNHRNAAHWLSLKPRKNAWGPWNYAHTWDSLLAWEGITIRGDPINLQAWEWVNPRPNEPIVSVELRLEPVDPGVKVGLVALTAVE